MKTVRIGGHAGSDVEAAYRSRAEIEVAQREDPLLMTAARLASEAGISSAEIAGIYARISDQARHAMEAATERPKLTSAKDVMASVVPPRVVTRAAPATSLDQPAANEPQHLSRMVSLVLAEQMQRHEEIVVFGEDVGRKGGVYGATTRLQQQFGRTRVFDTLLDEQAILGNAIGFAHNGLLPIPEIQFLAYVHNAEDQLRGEAATLSFFSRGQYTNPMVVRIAGLGYQKGFGGHFHNDNSVNVFRDIPGIVVACPSSAAEAARLMRESVRLAREEGRVVVFIEPIALYGTKDLHEDGDGEMLSVLNEISDAAPLGEVAVHGEGRDLLIATYGNGTYMARRCAKRLAAEGIATRVLDLRWLHPLPVDAVLAEARDCEALLVVDECRRTGSLAEEMVCRLVEDGFDKPLARLNSDDSFIPLGPAAEEVLLSEAQILAAARKLTGKGDAA